jgi:hypothetical protein
MTNIEHVENGLLVWPFYATEALSWTCNDTGFFFSKKKKKKKGNPHHTEVHGDTTYIPRHHRHNEHAGRITLVLP